MRVLWLSHFYPYPPAGGALQRSYHLLRQMAGRHQVHLVSLRKERDRPEPEEVAGHYDPPEAFCESVRLFPIPAEESRLRKLLMIASGLWDPDPYDDRWLASTAYRRYLDREIDIDRFDLVHLDTIGLAQYSEALPGLPAVMNHHNIESHMMARRAEDVRGWLRRAYMRLESRKLARWERRWCGGYDDNLVVSRLDGERLEKTVPDVSWTVVPNGVDTEFFRPGEPGTAADGPREGLVFVGRMSWYPNRDAIEWLLDEIWPAVRQEWPELSLTLVGSSPPERAKEAPNVRATGFVPDVRPYLNGAAVYVCPIRTGGGTRLKILDCMAMGVPLVATEMSVEGLDLEDRRHYLRAETPAEFTDAIRELRQDEDLGARLAKASREEAVRRFSWKRIGEKLDAAYGACVSP
mgnify:CR=1 FL=1